MGKALKIPVVMKTWAGDGSHDFDYICRSLPSLINSGLPDNIEIVIYDDGSTNTSLLRFLQHVSNNNERVRLVLGKKNKGPNLAQQDIYNWVVNQYPKTPFYINVDDDVIYHHGWFQKLLNAKRLCNEAGLNGVFTALNMPYRKPFASLDINTNRYLLKWKQPALNWLIPRQVYQHVGPFMDEGIAYDTVYSHWMRLKHYPVICLTPSYVQNIGMIGAYAFDDTTTAVDFIGEGYINEPIKRLFHMSSYYLKRLPEKCKRIINPTATNINPIRWGTEFIHEGLTAQGKTVAMFSVNDSNRLGWTDGELKSRILKVRKANLNFGVRESAPLLQVNRSGNPVWIEIPWRFAPNLRELVILNKSIVKPVEIFRSIITQLRLLHSCGIVHNKIRQDNIYFYDENNCFVLYWLGTEPISRKPFSKLSNNDLINLLSGALNKWALPETREMFAVRYLEAMAPEVIDNGNACLQSDIYSAAAISLLTLHPPLKTMNQLKGRSGRTCCLRVLSSMGINKRIENLFRRCLKSDPRERPADAIEVYESLKHCL